MQATGKHSITYGPSFSNIAPGFPLTRPPALRHQAAPQDAVIQSPGFPAMDHTTTRPKLMPPAIKLRTFGVRNEKRRFPGDLASISSVNPRDTSDTPPAPPPLAI